MDKPNQRKSFNGQLSWMYCLAIVHIVLSVVGFMLNYLKINSDYLYVSIITLNVLGLYSFQPWQIMKTLNEGYAYKKRLEIEIGEKVDV